jgi:hypothetical protein
MLCGFWLTNLMIHSFLPIPRSRRSTTFDELDGSRTNFQTDLSVRNHPQLSDSQFIGRLSETKVLHSSGNHGRYWSVAATDASSNQPPASYRTVLFGRRMKNRADVIISTFLADRNFNNSEIANIMGIFATESICTSFYFRSGNRDNSIRMTGTRLLKFVETSNFSRRMKDSPLFVQILPYNRYVDHSWLEQVRGGTDTVLAE